MSGRTERDLDEIIAFGGKYDEFCESIQSCCNLLVSEASAAESALKDEISQKSINAIYEYANRVKDICDQGDQPVKELVKRAKKEKDELELLKRGWSR